MNNNIEIDANEVEAVELEVFEFELDDEVEGLMHRC